MIRLNTIILLLLIILAAAQEVDLIAKKNSSKSGQVTNISWESIKGAKKYMVIITDTKNSVILKREVNTNFVNFKLPVGEYRIRIGTVNKFSKIASWSDWTEIKIVKGK